MRRVIVRASERAGYVELDFRYDERVVARIRALRTRTWDPDARVWQVSVEHMDQLAAELRAIGVRLQLASSFGPVPAITGLPPAGATGQRAKPPPQHGPQPPNRSEAARPTSHSNDVLLARAAEELRLRGYSPKTALAYLKLIERFVAACGDRAPTIDLAREHLLEQLGGGISVGYHGQVAAALRFFCTRVLREQLPEGALPSPRRGRSIPHVLSVEDVKRLITSVRNPAHRLLLLLLYSSGLRVSEVVRLQLRDIDRDRRLITVRLGKGHKDRVTLFSDHIDAALEAYLVMSQRVDRRNGHAFLFPSRHSGKPITTRTVQHMVAAAAERAGIMKNVTPHTLRHCFATHLLEQGVDLRYIQELLGHASSRTTEVYTHVTQPALMRIRSPLDSLDMLP